MSFYRFLVKFPLPHIPISQHPHFTTSDCASHIVNEAVVARKARNAGQGILQWISSNGITTLADGGQATFVPSVHHTMLGAGLMYENDVRGVEGGFNKVRVNVIFKRTRGREPEKVRVSSNVSLNLFLLLPLPPSHYLLRTHT